MLVFSVPPWVRKNGPGWARGRLSPVQHGATCLATASRQVGPYWAQHRKHCSTRSVIDTKKRRKFQRKRAFWGFRIGPGCVPHFEAIWASTWGMLNGSKLGPICGMLEQSWAEVGPKWVPTWGLVGQRWFGPICKMCKLPATACNFWWPALCSKVHPPQLELYRWTEGCSNRTDPFLNYHASAPLVRADFDSLETTTLLL